MRTAWPRLLGLLGLVLLLGVGLVWLAPATWLDLALQRASGGVLSLGETDGTIWRGSGILQAMLPRGSAVTLSPVRWQLRAGPLLHGRLRLGVLSARTGQAILEASLDRAGLEVHEARLELPAAILGSLSPTLRAADLSGRLTLRSNGFKYAGGRFAGTADLDWRDAASGLAAVSPLGSYHLALTGEGAGLACRLDSPGEAALALTGKTVWQPGRPFTFEGSARPAEANRQELAPLLRILGREVAPGTFRLKVDANVGAL